MCARLGLGPVSQRAAERLRLHTDGHPLYLRALLGELTLDHIENLAEPLPVPHSFARLVQADLRQASDPARRLAAGAAVVGGEVPLATLAWVAQVDDVLPALAELQASIHIVIKESGGGPTIEFSHPLVRSAIYDDIGIAARLLLHDRASKVTEGLPALSHRVAASTVADPSLVRDLEASAEECHANGAHHAASDALFAAARLSAPGPNATGGLSMPWNSS